MVASSAGWSDAFLFDNDGESVQDSEVFERYYQVELPRGKRISQTDMDLLGMIVDVASGVHVVPCRQGDPATKLSRWELLQWLVAGENEGWQV